MRIGDLVLAGHQVVRLARWAQPHEYFRLELNEVGDHWSVEAYAKLYSQTQRVLGLPTPQDVIWVLMVPIDSEEWEPYAGPLDPADPITSRRARHSSEVVTHAAPAAEPGQLTPARKAIQRHRR